jgi:hypothetical protein
MPVRRELRSLLTGRLSFVYKHAIKACMELKEFTHQIYFLTSVLDKM